MRKVSKITANAAIMAIEQRGLEGMWAYVDNAPGLSGNYSVWVEDGSSGELAGCNRVRISEITEPGNSASQVWASITCWARVIG